VALAGVVATTFAALVTIRTGFAAVVFAVFRDVVSFADFAFAIRTGAFGFGYRAHSGNT